jgi:hypothetical protein
VRDPLKGWARKDGALAGKFPRTRLPAPAGRDRDQVQRQEIASTLTERRSSAVLLRRGLPSLLSQFLSHSSPSGAVHRRPPRSGLRRSRTVTDGGERGPALLESV